MASPLTRNSCRTRAPVAQRRETLASIPQLRREERFNQRQQPSRDECARLETSYAQQLPRPSQHPWPECCLFLQCNFITSVRCFHSRIETIEKSQESSPTWRSRQTERDFFPGDVPEPGSHLRCSCGWTPPPGNTSVQRSNANSHWQICKGERAPAMPRKNRLAILLQAGQTAAQKANAKNEEDCDKWCSDIRSKHPELKDTLCDPNFDPFYKIITWDDNSHAVSAERSVVLPKCVVFLAKSEQLTLRSVHGRPLSMEGLSTLAGRPDW